MMYYIQTFLLTFIEAYCCTIFCETFLKKRFAEKRWLDSLFLLLWVIAFGLNALWVDTNIYLRAAVCILIIGVMASVLYRGRLYQRIFVSVGYYGLLVCVDRIMLIFVDYVTDSQPGRYINSWIKVTILALLCKMLLFIIIIFINKRFKADGSLNLITDKEWIRFLFFPVITVACMITFALEEGEGNQSVLMVCFALVLSNFLAFSIISNIVDREKKLQQMRVSEERVKNQLEMYHYMEDVYKEQRKKAHDYRNYLGCLSGLLQQRKYGEAKEYLKAVDDNWVEEQDYINTNHAVVNSILNQKYKQAKKKGIPILFAMNDLGALPIQDTDLVMLLANLIDNAMEACEKITSGSKVIKLRFVIDKDKVIISVKNPVAGKIKSIGDRIMSTKSKPNEHGIGMENIDSVVKKYKGENIWSCEQGYFTHSVIIKLL